MSTQNPIVVTISGGVVQDVENVPAGVTVIIRDYDNYDNETGDEYSEAIYKYEGA